MLTLSLSFFPAKYSSAQTDTAKIILQDTAKSSDSTLNNSNTASAEDDDEFNVFLLTFASLFFAAMFGAAVIGAFAATLFLLIIFLFVSAGILSASVIVGIYKRSVQSGFKTLIFILSSLTGIVIGSVGLFLANKLFELNYSNGLCLTIGAIAGFVGGILISFAIIKIIQKIITAFRKKFNV